MARPDSKSHPASLPRSNTRPPNSPGLPVRRRWGSLNEAAALGRRQPCDARRRLTWDPRSPALQVARISQAIRLTAVAYEVPEAFRSNGGYTNASRPASLPPVGVGPPFRRPFAKPAPEGTARVSPRTPNLPSSPPPPHPAAPLCRLRPHQPPLQRSALNYPTHIALESHVGGGCRAHPRGRIPVLAGAEAVPSAEPSSAQNSALRSAPVKTARWAAAAVRAAMFPSPGRSVAPCPIHEMSALGQRRMPSPTRAAVVDG